MRCGQIAVKGDKLINALNRLRPFDKQLFIRLHNAPTAKSDALAVMPFVIAHVAFAADTVVLFQKRLFFCGAVRLREIQIDVVISILHVSATCQHPVYLVLGDEIVGIF